MKYNMQKNKCLLWFILLIACFSNHCKGETITTLTHSKGYATRQDLNNWRAVGTKHKTYYLLCKGAYLESPTIDFANYTQLTIKIKAGTYYGSSNNSNYIRISWQSGSECKEIAHLLPTSNNDDLIRLTIDTNQEPMQPGKIRIEAPFSEKSIGCRIYSFLLSGTDVELIDSAIPPAISPSSCNFTDSQKITISSKSHHTIYFTLDNTPPTSASTRYQAPFTIDTTTTVKAVTYNPTQNKSSCVTETYTLKKEPNVHFEHDTIITSVGKVIQNKQTLYYKGNTRAITWSSSNDSIAKLKNGQLKAAAKGSCTITANVSACQEYKTGSANYHLTVKEKPSKDSTNNVTIFSEDFEQYANQYTPYLTAPMENWETPTKANRVYGVHHCIELGIADEPGNICSKPLSRSGKAILTFRAAAWDYSKEKTKLTLVIHQSNGKEEYTFSLPKTKEQYSEALRQSLNSYKVELDGLIANKSYLQFKGTTKYNRFFLSDIYVVASTKHSKDGYTLHGFWEQEDLNTALRDTDQELTSIDCTDVEFDPSCEELQLPNNINPNCLIYTKEGHHFHQNEIHPNTNGRYSCEKMVLTDKASFSCTDSIETKKGVYHRHFGKHPSGWYSLYLPFSLSQAELKAAGFTHVERCKRIDSEEKRLLFEAVTATKANTPYLVTFDKPTGTITDADTISFTFEEQILNSTTLETAAFKGTYSNLYNGELAGKYVLNATGDALQLCTDKVKLSAFRAYLDVGEEKETATNASAYKIVHTTTTSSITTCPKEQLKIEVINHRLNITTPKPYMLYIYNLSGLVVYQKQLLQGTTEVHLQQPGIYFIHHQKITLF
ncbi:MAG: chitobiase/beta-hexosaminidase C-terminal domain-containing protein [Bacteroidaceae bacterium]